MSIEQLGRQFNLATSATTAGVRVALRNHAGIGIVLIGATSGAATISEANAASGGTSQALSVITRYYTQVNGVWTKVTQAAGSTITAATGGLAYVYITGQSLSDGFAYISASHASGSFVYVLGDPDVQRAPANLKDVRA
jgi:hypothetical protein